MSDTRWTPAEVKWLVHIGLAGAQRMNHEFNAYTVTLPNDVNMGLKNFTVRHIDKLKELAEIIINNKNDEAPNAPISTIIQRARDEWGDVIELDEQGLAKPIHDKLLIEFELLDRWVGMMAKYILRRAGESAFLEKAEEYMRSRKISNETITQNLAEEFFFLGQDRILFRNCKGLFPDPVDSSAPQKPEPSAQILKFPKPKGPR